MAGLVPAIHDFALENKSWMTATRAVMTWDGVRALGVDMTGK
jgi:hypothetical protein